MKNTMRKARDTARDRWHLRLRSAKPSHVLTANGSTIRSMDEQVKLHQKTSKNIWLSMAQFILEVLAWSPQIHRKWLENPWREKPTDGKW